MEWTSKQTVYFDPSSSATTTTSIIINTIIIANTCIAMIGLFIITILLHIIMAIIVKLAPSRSLSAARTRFFFSGC